MRGLPTHGVPLDVAEGDPAEGVDEPEVNVANACRYSAAAECDGFSDRDDNIFGLSAAESQREQFGYIRA